MTEPIIEAMIAQLEQLGYVVARPSAQTDEPSPSDSEVLRNRMETLAGDLQVIDGITKRGAMLPVEYRRDQLPALTRYAGRVFDALAWGAPVRNPWDRERGNG